MKDLRKTKFYLDLQIKNLADEILIHRSTYTEKVFKRFYIDKTHPLSTLMVVRSLNMKRTLLDPVRITKTYLVLKYHTLVQLVS